MRDFIEKNRNLSDRQSLVYGKLTTVVWGVIITGFAFLVGGISDTVIESINMIGSAFYGPILAAFLVGVLSKRATTAGIFIGVLGGVGFNVVVWLFFPGVFWMWWNLFGLLAAVAVTFGVSLFTRARPLEEIERYTLIGSGFFREQKLWHAGYTMLIGYFIVILAIMLGLDYLSDSLLKS